MIGLISKANTGFQIGILYAKSGVFAFQCTAVDIKYLRSPFAVL